MIDLMHDQPMSILQAAMARAISSEPAQVIAHPHRL